MNLPEIMAHVKRMTSDSSGRVFRTHGELVEHAQTAYEKVHGRFTGFDEGYGLISKDYTWVEPDSYTKEASYLLPRFCESVKMAEILNASGESVRLAVPHDPVELKSAEVAPTFAFYFRNRHLVLWSVGGGWNTSAATLRVSYYRAPANLALIKPTAVSGQNITFGRAAYDGLGKILAIDDFYKGCQLEVIAGPGLGEVYDIDAFVGSTMVATVLTGETVTATTDSVLSVLPAIPTRAHTLIPLLVAMDAARIEENKRQYELIGGEVASIWLDIENTLSLRQVQAARAVQYTYD
jgi:hypothetical protein